MIAVGYMALCLDGSIAVGNETNLVKHKYKVCFEITILFHFKHAIWNHLMTTQHDSLNLQRSMPFYAVLTPTSAADESDVFL